MSTDSNWAFHKNGKLKKEYKNGLGCASFGDETNSKDCTSCGYRMETKIGSYSKQTIQTVKPYCANPDCTKFNKKQARKLNYEMGKA